MIERNDRPDLFAQMNNAVIDIQAADLQAIEHPLRKLARFLAYPDLAAPREALTAGIGLEAFTMLTMPPGPDVAPYHDRQIVILDRSRWANWLDHGVGAKSIIRPLPTGSLQVERVS